MHTSYRERKRSRSRSRDRKRSERDRERDRGDIADEGRKVKYRFWDIPPAGYEHLSPKEFKELQGQFTYNYSKISTLKWSV